MIPAAEDAAAVPKAALTDTDYMKHISREKSKTFRKETFSERRAFLLFLRNAVKRDDDHRRLHSFLHIQNHSSCFFVTVLKNFNPLSEEIKLRGCRSIRTARKKAMSD